jgi:hypothetical protein
MVSSSRRRASRCAACSSLTPRVSLGRFRFKSWPRLYLHSNTGKSPSMICPSVDL